MPISRREPVAAISLGLLALMVSGPFLFPVHTDPIPSFWSEWWAGALGLAAAAAGLIAARRRVVILPLVLLVPGALLLTLVLQYALGRLVFPQIGLLHAIYLIWAGILMVLGRQLVETAGWPLLADVIAGALVLGALIGAGIALAQWRGVDAGIGWMLFSQPGGAIYGNLGQTNHHAHYSWLGIASAFYLCRREYLSRYTLWGLVLLIGFGSVLSGSRSVFVYPLVLVAAIGWFGSRQQRGPATALVVDAALLLVVTIGLSLFGAWATARLADPTPAQAAQAAGGFESLVAGSRHYQSLSGPSPRIEIARSAWSAFLEYPLMGQGAGNFRWASFVAASNHPGDDPFGVPEHAHNIILHLLAEFGALPTGIVILLLGLWAKGFLARPRGAEQFWCAAVLGMGAVHSLLEYPLWYTYFLGPTALLLGAADSRQIVALPARRGAFYVAVLALMGAFLLTTLRKDYAMIEAASYAPLAAHSDREQAWRISVDRLLRLQRESLLSPWALLAFAILAEPSRQQAQDRARLCERSLRMFPARWLVTRCAMQLAIAGRTEDAGGLARSVLRAFPAERSATVEQLAGGAREYPEIAPLWESSRDK